ncbi:hypothetical protein KSS87_013909, partial [Heliosperma pusillum]
PLIPSFYLFIHFHPYIFLFSSFYFLLSQLSFPLKPFSSSSALGLIHFLQVTVGWKKNGTTTTFLQRRRTSQDDKVEIGMRRRRKVRLVVVSKKSMDI